MNDNINQPLLSSLDDDDDDDDDDGSVSENREMRRNLVSFWIIGLCNNFGYVVMLSAAFDILKEQTHNVKPTQNTTLNLITGKNQDIERDLSQNITGFHCNPASTGLILLADILPTLLVKLTAPFYMQRINYHIRIGFVIICLVMSLIILAFSPSVLVSIFAVVLASLGSGLGEITFLSLSSYYKRSTVSAWSSGTGMSGVTGAVAYAGLLQIGLSQRNAVLFLLIVPFIFAISVWVLLKFPITLRLTLCSDKEVEPIALLPAKTTVAADRTKDMPLKSKLELILTLRKYMVPLFLVYLAEYTINQGLYELLYYDISFLNQAEQYRWFQVDYQVAVFISRSSVYLLHIRKVMLLSVGQWVIFIVLLLEVCFTFIPYIWITFGIIFVEGLLGGATYVNTFFTMSEEIEPDIREFALGATSFADSCGIGLSTAIGIPLHDALCKLKRT